jgi:hypothetical protein
MARMNLKSSANNGSQKTRLKKFNFSVFLPAILFRYFFDRNEIINLKREGRKK